MLLKTKDNFALPRALAAICCCTLLVSQSGLLFGQTDAPKTDASGTKSPGQKGAITTDQTGTTSNKSKDQKPPELPPLAQMLATALENNPDLGVAESQVREAQAQLKRTRLNVVQQVMELRQAWETQRKLVAGALERVKYIEKEVEGEVASYTVGAVEANMNKVSKARAALKQAEMEVIQAQAKLAAIEAKIPYVLGTETAAVTSSEKQPTQKKVSKGQPQTGFTYGYVGAVSRQPRTPKLSTVDVDTLYKLRAALDNETEVDFIDQPLSEIVLYLNDIHGIRMMLDGSVSEVDEKWRETSISLVVSGVSLRAALQAMGDNYPKIAFVVRDYGLLVTLKGHEPEDSVSLADFWKKTSQEDKINLDSLRKKRAEGEKQGRGLF